MVKYQLEPGRAYSFEFINPFNIYNSIYTVLSITSYNDLVSQGIDLLTLYTSVGKTEQDFNNDLPSITSNPIYKLQKLSDLSIIHIPPILIAKEPNFNIIKVTRVGVNFELGVFKDLNVLVDMREAIKNILSDYEGIVLSDDDIKFLRLKEEYMTETDYNNIISSREAIKKNMDTYYTKCKKLEKEIQELKTKINNYEKLLVELNN